jgi:hypothetical protein
MSQGSERLTLFTDRVNTAWSGLLADIEDWRVALPEETDTKHHVSQFGSLCQQVHDRLVEAYQGGGWESADDRLVFESMITGVLTAQWALLRQVAHQRLPDNPYQQVLGELDRRAADDYSRLRQAVPKQVRDHLSPSPPLVYLGRLQEPSLFSPKAPSILSVPLGASRDNRAKLAVSHGVVHAVLKQIPCFVPELGRLATVSFGRPKQDRQRAILVRTILGWLNQIVEDMIATALAGLDFARNALWINAIPESQAGITDERHPPSFIRPYVHLQALTYLAEERPGPDEELDAEIVALANDIETTFGQYASRRFESIPALAVMPLSTVRDEMIQVIEQALDAKLKAFAGRSLGEVLIDCATGSPASEQIPLPGWGEISDEEFPQLDMGIPESLIDFAVPFPPAWPLCCRIGLWWCCMVDAPMTKCQ